MIMDSIIIENDVAIRARNPALAISLPRKCRSESDDRRTYILPGGLSLWWACSKSDIISRYPGPATQARSAMSRGSPAKNGGLDMITSNKKLGASPDIRSDRTTVTRSQRPLAREL